MKKLTAILLILALLLTALTAFAEDADDPVALTIGEHELYICNIIRQKKNYHGKKTKLAGRLLAVGNAALSA